MTFFEFFTNISNLDPAATNLPTLKDFAQLQTNQSSYLSQTLKSDRLKLVFDSFGNIQYSNGYLSKPVIYSPDYNNPVKSINWIAQLYGLPQSTTLELTVAANKATDKKGFLKNTLAFIGKNWQSILTGVLSVSAAVQYSQNSGLSETDPNINPATGLPYGEIPAGGTGANSVLSFLNENKVLIGGLALVGFGFYYLSKK